MRPEEIALVREVVRWRRAHGVSFFLWRPGVGFGHLAEWKVFAADGKQTNVSYEPRAQTVAATRDYRYGSFTRLPAATVTEAVDMLVVLGYLPPRFSSAYRAGWDASGSLIGVGNDVIADLEAELEPAVR